MSNNNNLTILGYPHKKARKKSFRIFLAWDFFLVIVDMLMNTKKAKKLLLQFVPMFPTFWLKCPGLKRLFAIGGRANVSAFAVFTAHTIKC